MPIHILDRKISISLWFKNCDIIWAAKPSALDLLSKRVGYNGSPVSLDQIPGQNSRKFQADPWVTLVWTALPFPVLGSVQCSFEFSEFSIFRYFYFTYKFCNGSHLLASTAEGVGILSGGCRYIVVRSQNRGKELVFYDSQVLASKFRKVVL